MTLTLYRLTILWTSDSGQNSEDRLAFKLMSSGIFFLEIKKNPQRNRNVVIMLKFTCNFFLFPSNSLLVFSRSESNSISFSCSVKITQCLHVSRSDSEKVCFGVSIHDVLYDKRRARKVICTHPQQSVL